MSKRNSSLHNNYVSNWLLCTSILVAIMIIIGGLTRLTDSGLSITKWDLFSGIIPPLSSIDWEKYFNMYKQTSEFKIQNFSMTINDFKTIYWWEYIHRLLGRFLGLFYLFPLLYFIYFKKINKRQSLSFVIIFFMILLQGIIGWFMVKSGLSERVDVTHYTLSLHLSFAFIIFISLIWQFLKYNNLNVIKKKIPYYLPNIFLLLILLQILFGALVSGLDAGKIYQTWPLMELNYFPDDSIGINLFSLKIFDNPSMLQFIHRNLAYFILLLFFIILLIIFKNDYLKNFKKISLLVFLSLIIQVILGIYTILSGAQIIIASMHQIGSIILIVFSTILVFKNSTTN